VLPHPNCGSRYRGSECDAALVTQLLTHLAVVPLRRGDYPRAAELAEEALALTRELGDKLTANVSLSLLAQAAWASDEHGRAARYFREALTMASELADKVDCAYYMQGLAAVAASRGEPRCAFARVPPGAAGGRGARPLRARKRRTPPTSGVRHARSAGRSGME